MLHRRLQKLQFVAYEGIHFADHPEFLREKAGPFSLVLKDHDASSKRENDIIDQHPRGMPKKEEISSVTHQQNDDKCKARGPQVLPKRSNSCHNEHSHERQAYVFARGLRSREPFELLFELRIDFDL